MAIGSVGDVADNLLSAFLQNSLKASLGSQNTVGLFVPQELTDPSTRLTARELVDLLRSVRSNLVSLGAAAARLDLASPTSAFYALAVTSTDSTKITASVVPGVSESTTPARVSYSFTVTQLAVAQANAGTRLASNANNSFKTGTNTLRVTQNGTSTDVSFTVNGSDSNLTVLTNMANAVNNAPGVGVTATVITDAVAGTSQIVLQADLAGTTNAFTLSDVQKTPVRDAGVQNATTTAVNASYTQDGVALSSDENTFFVGSDAHLRVTFLGTTSSPVVVTMGPDTAQLAGAITALVNAFGDTKAFFDNQAALYPDAVTHLNSVLSRVSAQLRTIGVDVAEDGTLSVDTARLGVALQSYMSSVKRALGDAGGFAKELRAIADALLATPLVEKDPLPPLRAGFSPRVLVGTFASRLNAAQLQGLLVDALV